MRNSCASQLSAAAAAAANNNNNMLSNKRHNGIKKVKNKLSAANSKRIEDQPPNLEAAATNSDNCANPQQDHESPTINNDQSKIVNKNESSAKKKICIEISHVSRNLPQSSSSSETHEWTVSLKPLTKFKEIFGASIKRVVFNLHSSFAHPARSFSKPPFKLTEKGWGSFYLRVDVIFKDSHHSLNYDLQLNNFAEKSLRRTRRYFIKIEDFTSKSKIEEKSPEISLESQKSDPLRLIMNPHHQNNSKDSLQNNTQNKSDENIKRFNSVFGQSLLNCNSQMSKRNRAANSSKDQSVQNTSNKTRIIPENLPQKSGTNVLNKCEEESENYAAKKACLIAIENKNGKVQKNSYCVSSDEGGSSSTCSSLSSKPNNNNNNNTNEINFGCRGDKTNICGGNQRLEQIQSQIMRNNNCQMLKTIVECVNHSGNLQKTNMAYTFDLCKLDSDTIVKIQNILGAS